MLINYDNEINGNTLLKAFKNNALYMVIRGYNALYYSWCALKINNYNQIEMHSVIMNW